MTDTANSDCRILLDVLQAQGLRDAVLSPGSRNAPLLVGIASRPKIKNHVITDERTAGFMALGMAIATHRPVLLVCTSGTALYNYAPAVAEAFYQNVPLIVLSADRPSRWIDQDDSQTLHQYGALDNIVKRSYDIPLDEGSNAAIRNQAFATEREWFVNRIVNDAWIESLSGTPGPVHINLPLDNPLGKTVDIDVPAVTRTVNVINNDSNLPPHILKELGRRIRDRKILITAGFMQPDHKLNKAVNELLKRQNVAIVAEPLSNLHLSGDAYMIDAVLLEKDPQLYKDLAPDIVISMGGALVSRMLKDFLRTCNPSEHWTLGDTDPGVDCFQSLTTHINVSPANFFKGMAGVCKWLDRNEPGVSVPDYAEIWRGTRRSAAERRGRYTTESPWSELVAFDILFRNLPEECNLFLGNGTPVRYGALLLDTLPHACFGNRGVSGIEGTSATALGMAMKYNGLTLLVSGDMSFAYAPQILGTPDMPDTFRIVVVNNGGGGIFRFIGTTRHLAERDRYFCAENPQPLRKLADAYDWNYFLADSTEALECSIADFLSTPRAIMEIKVDPECSSEILKNYLKVE